MQVNKSALHINANVKESTHLRQRCVNALQLLMEINCVLGFHLNQNLKTPFISLSVTELPMALQHNNVPTSQNVQATVTCKTQSLR